jgi:dihydrolipoamide dehydrogenase
LHCGVVSGLRLYVAEPATALYLEATVDDMMYAVHAHPTLWEALGDAYAAVRGLAIHI